MHRVLAGVLAAFVVLSVVAVPAAAQSQRVAGTVVVEEGETVNGFRAFAGTVIVRGTVTGDLEAYGGNVVVAETGTVDGRVRAYGGSVHIAGQVNRNTVAYGGSITVAESGIVYGNFGAFGGTVTVAGTVSGDVNAVADTIVLADTAEVTGGVYYSGDLQDDGAAVQGPVESTGDLDIVPTFGLPAPIVDIYFLLVNLLVGAFLLALFPDSSGRIADRIVEAPLESAAAGIVVGVGGLLLALVLLLTIVGIPLAFAVLFGWLVVAWVGTVYARIAIGALALSRTEATQWWAPLVVGVVLVWLLISLPNWLGVPYVAGFLRTVVTVFGVGALALGAKDWYDSAEPRR